MKNWNLSRWIVVSLALPGMIVFPAWTPNLHGDQPTAPLTVHDVELQRDGTFHAQVLDRNGHPVAAVDALLIGHQTHQLARTDDIGRLTIRNLRGGTYQLRVDGGLQLFRLWTHGTAPPAAKAEAVLVRDTIVERGQRPVSDILCSPVLLGLIIAAAVAIPVAVHNSQGDSPSGS